MEVGSNRYSVRSFVRDDAGCVSNLMVQLGYDVSGVEVLERVEGIRKAGGEVLVVSEVNGPALGCVQAIRELRLAEGEFAELVSLVVNEGCRNMGLGGLLVNAVEDWCSRHELGCLRIRCNNTRHKSLGFYERAGFVKKKEQAVLEKCCL